MFFCFKQKTAYEMRISDWSSDVCSSDLGISGVVGYRLGRGDAPQPENVSAAPAQRQDDGSLILVRAPAEPAPPAPHAIPRHAVRERAIGVDVQPAREHSPTAHVDLSLSGEGGGRRETASSPDGEVTRGFD